MATKEASKRRITTERHNQVTWSGVCPGCGDYRIVTLTRWLGSEDAMDNHRRFGGAYLGCGGPNGHLCWHMTKSSSAARLYETFGPKSTK